MKACNKLCTVIINCSSKVLFIASTCKRHTRLIWPIELPRFNGATPTCRVRFNKFRQHISCYLLYENNSANLIKLSVQEERLYYINYWSLAMFFYFTEMLFNNTTSCPYI